MASKKKNLGSGIQKYVNFDYAISFEIFIKFDFSNGFY